MLASGLTMAQMFKDSHIQALEENMVREIKILEHSFEFVSVDEELANAAPYYTGKAKELADLTDSRVTFIHLDGMVIGDSERLPKEMDNHANREEIVKAAQGEFGSTIRFSDTIGEDMLYVAHRVTSNAGFDGYIRLSTSLEAVGEGLSKGWALMSGGLLVLFLAAAIVSYQVAKGLTKPLELITRVANEISHLDYDARVELHRKDEIGQLGQAINGMADSLQEQLQRIHDNEELMHIVLANMTGGILMVDPSNIIALINRGAERILHVQGEQLLGKPYTSLRRNHDFMRFIEEGIRTKESVQEERTVYDPEERTLQLDGVPMFDDDGSYRGMLFLIQDVTDIRRLEGMRSEFVANVSHELKTPIASVKGFAETLLTGVEDKELARSFIQIIYDEGDRLNRLIGDILELSKIESKRVPLEFAPVELKEMIDRMFEVLLPAASKKSITMSHNINEPIYIEGDEDRLGQILMNLLSNAINYTLEGGRVRIEASFLGEGTDEEKIRIIVSDTGIGIPKKDLPRIFERFYRVDKARSRSSGGTGLGLSIVKHLVDLHHGSIRVESKVGEGSSFILELPLIHHLDQIKNG